MSAIHHVLDTDRLELDEGHAAMLVGLPWYRSVPWAAIRELRVVVDGHVGAPDTMTIDGINFAELSTAAGYWPFTHKARVVIAADSFAKTMGVTTSVIIQGELAIPSPVNPDGSPLRIPFVASRVLGVHRRISYRP